MLLAQLQQLASVLKEQQAWRFFSSSVLIVYEGAARTPAAVNVRIRLIDFAHAFPLNACCGKLQQQGAAATTHVLSGPDMNSYHGLLGIKAAVEEALVQLKSKRGS
jgi:1D-myo-inositol-tetrakisphosphate 5-kinase/inositol-polyphosphate multikinase